MENENYRPYPSIGQSVLILLILLGTGIACVPLMFAKSWLSPEVIQFLSYVTVFGLTFLVVHRLRRRQSGRTDYRFGLINWRVPLLLALGSVAVLFGVVTPLGELIPVSANTQKMITEAAGQTGVVTLILFVFLAPLLEELVFRGVMLDGLLRSHKPVTAIAFASLLFGIAHFNEVQFVTGLVLGAFLGWVYYRTGSVGACIVVHLAANLYGFVLRFFIDPESDLDFGRSLFEMWGWTTTLIVIIGSWIVLVAAVLLLKREFDRFAIPFGLIVPESPTSSGTEIPGSPDSP